MFQKRFFLNLIVMISLVLGGGAVIAKAAPAPIPTERPSMALAGYTYNAAIKVANNATVSLPANYTVSFTLDTAALVIAGRLQNDCDDLRISFAGTTENEIDRLVTGCNTSATRVEFRTQAAIDPETADERYIFNYGNPAAENPPRNPANVYAFYDDFQDGDSVGWSEKGIWDVVADGDNNIYRYTGGGETWALSSTTLPASDIDYLAKIRGVDTPITNWIGLAFRIQDEDNFLTFYQSRDTSNFKFARIVNDNHNIIDPTPTITMPANTWHWLRVQAVGSTVRARIWADSVAEPAAWNYSTTDTTYQSSTNIGLTLYNHTTIADWDDIQVRRLVAVEPVVSLSGWWNNNFHYRRPLIITNTSASASLPEDYSARFVLDTATLIGSGQMKTDCSDLRVIFDTGLMPVEIDRVVESCNTDQTAVWFALQRPVAPSGQEQAYTIYYANAAAGLPPSDGMNVFLFFEDWEQGTAHWTGAGGLDPDNSGTMGTTTISAETALSPTHSQLITSRTSGGDAFSGFIPVMPSTTYAASVWASTPSAGVCVPVGFDPYTSAKVKGEETWFWTNNWPTSSTWSWRSSANFTTDATTAFIKLKSELWNQCAGSTVYLDNIALHYAVSSAPTLASGLEETNLPAPTIGVITDNGPISLGNPIQVSAQISTPDGTIDTATLRIVSPQVAEVSMSLGSGSTTDGTWQASFTPLQGGVYTYRVFTTASTGLSRLSATRTFTVNDTTPPVITLVSKIDPIQVKNNQTLVVDVTDDGVLSSVNVNVEGSTRPMVANGSQYSYTWRVMTTGTIPYTVTATDSSGNTTTLNGSFVSEPLEVDVCTWKDCRQGAASWSIDDGVATCRADLEAAGIRGTYYYDGTSTLDWFGPYSAAGHEVASHTVGHDCSVPACFPNCTKESLAALPVDPAAVQAYRLNQLEPNIAAIEAGTNKPVMSMAWPCGTNDPNRWEATENYVLGARGYYDWVAELKWVEDINNPTPENYMLLNSAHTYRQDFIDQAYTEGKWATIVSHSSCEGIPYMGAQSANGNLWVAPIGDVLKYIKVRDASVLTNYTRQDRSISFDARHSLSSFVRPSISTTPYTFLPIAYDNPVTLKVHILDSDTVASVTVDDSPVAYTVKDIDGSRYVTFDAALNTTRHVVVNLTAPAPTISAVASADTVELGTAATVTANVVAASGTTLSSATLRVLSPVAQDYPMTPVSGSTSQFTASFTPATLGTFTYRVVATNNLGATAQSAQDSFTVVDTTPPDIRAQAQSANQVNIGGSNTLSVEGYDLGNLSRAVLSTDESGSWQDFEWPVTDWWNQSWTRRRSITISETAGMARTSETVELLVEESTFTGLTNCNELRVADQNRVELPVQVTGTAPSCRLHFQADVAANGSSTYYVYYGNPSAPAPTYTSDLTTTTSGTLRTIQNSYLNLDLESSSGILSRISLPGGTNTNLPLSTMANTYWGLHQVCSTAHGNITGKNGQCVGGTAPASGLVLTETLTGPLVREYTLTSVKGDATYTMRFRFFANAPYYQYTLDRSGTTATVMNNFWYLNGNYPRLGSGTIGDPAVSYNTYDNAADHLRIASPAGAIPTSIDGEDNDGTALGGVDYFHPSAQSLSLYVATGADQTVIQSVLARLNAPLILSAPGALESVPTGKYGSPIVLDPTTGWELVAFTWQNSDVQNRWVQWRIRLYDVSGNEFTTPSMSFYVGVPTAVYVSSFSGEAHLNTVQLNWETAQEVGLIGFNVYRSTSLTGLKEKQNVALIPSKEPGQMRGAIYQFTQIAEAGQRYYYWLEQVDSEGTDSTGPVVVQTDHLIFLPTLRK